MLVEQYMWVVFQVTLKYLAPTSQITMLLDTVEQLLWRHLTYPLTDLSSTATVLKTVTVEQSM